MNWNLIIRITWVRWVLLKNSSASMPSEMRSYRRSRIGVEARGDRGGALVTEVVFSYPGIGYLLLAAIQNQDYFLIQGCFLFIIIGVLIANLRLILSMY
jgi:hypothetical protein